MNVLLTGASGCLGTYLLRSVPKQCSVTALRFRHNVDHEATLQADLRNRQAVADIFEKVKPEVVIHTAYDSSDLQGGIIEATRNLVDQAKHAAAQFIHLSSDLVLSGEQAPYDESVPADPIIPYGQAKADVERYVSDNLPDAAIIRTSLIVGTDPVNTSSQWILDALEAGQNVSLFVDELRCPILAGDLASMIWEIAQLGKAEQGGIWNCVGPESLSRFAIGLILAKRFGLDSERIIPQLSKDFESPRPRDLRMTAARATGMLKTRPRPISTIVTDS